MLFRVLFFLLFLPLCYQGYAQSDSNAGKLFKQTDLKTLDNLNALGDSYWPFLSLDGKQMFLTVRRRSGNHIHEQEDLYISNRTPEGWSIPINLRIFNTRRYDEGAPCLSGDGKYLFYVVSNKPSDYGSADIYYCYRDKTGRWIPPKNVGPNVNTKYWESSPSISTCMRYLFFSSNRPGGLGNNDLWCSEVTRNEDGSLSFAQPRNLGSPINTAGNEVAPFLHANDEVLYFSSNGHDRDGDLDIYKAFYRDGHWGDVEALGAGINSDADEFGIFVTANGEEAYLVSTRMQEDGRTKNIYKIDLPDEVRPRAIGYVKGIVKDAATGEHVGAKLEIYSAGEREVIGSTSSTIDDGMFFLPDKREGAEEAYLIASSPGYLTQRKRLGKVNYEEGAELNLSLYPSKKGVTIILEEVKFEYDQSVLTPDACVAMELIVSLMEDNPEVKIELRGHADAEGSESYNMELSQRRAQAVADYLQAAGIDSGRIKAVGYGKTQPLVDNATAEGRAKNRRTELVIESCKEADTM